jgi:hypothetical protein
MIFEQVDQKSFNPEVLQRLIVEISNVLKLKYHDAFKAKLVHEHQIRTNPSYKSTVELKPNDKFVVVDIGAGLVPMTVNTLDMIKRASDLIPKLDGIKDLNISSSSEQFVYEVEYIAFESNCGLYHGILDEMSKRGFKLLPDFDYELSNNDLSRDDIRTFNKIIFSDNSCLHEYVIKINVHVISVDFTSDEALQWLDILVGSGINRKLDLIIGSCVADLMSPERLSAHLIEMAEDSGGLLYLPITFSGETKLNMRIDKLAKLKRMEENACRSNRDSRELKNIPSDEFMFATYNDCLRRLGQHLDSERLVNILESYGCKVFTCQSTESKKAGGKAEECLIPYSSLPRSDWHISPSAHPYMWKCMMRFFSLGTTFQLLGSNWDVNGWFHALCGAAKKDCDIAAAKSVNHTTTNETEQREHHGLEIIASNVDILARLPKIEKFLRPKLRHSWLWQSNDGSKSVFRQEFGDFKHYDLKTTPPLHDPSLSNIISPSVIKINEALQENRQKDDGSSLPNLIEPTKTSIHSHSHQSTVRHMVEFSGVQKVGVISEPTPKPERGQVVLSLECSLVSTGTELKVFLGEMDDEMDIDTVFEGMKGKGFRYPLRYG